MGKLPVLWLFLFFVLLIGGALAPATPKLWGESRFSHAVQKWAAEGKEIAGLPEQTIRSHIQAIAREKGFHIEFEDIVVRYRDAREGETMPVPVEVGYTLPLELSLFGFFPWQIVAVRVHPIRGASDS